MSFVDRRPLRKHILLVNLDQDLADFLNNGLQQFSVSLEKTIPETGELKSLRMIVIGIPDRGKPNEIWRRLQLSAKDVPVLCVCANEKQALSALRAGCFEALVKPVLEGEILTAVERGIEGHTWLCRIRRLARQNRLLEEQNRRLRQEVEALLSVGERARFQNLRRPLEEMLTDILEEIRRVLHLDRVLLAIVNTKRQVAELKLSLGVKGLQLGDVCARTAPSDPIWSRFVEEHRPVVVGAKRLGMVPAQVAQAFSSGFVAAPLNAKGEIVGILLGSREKALWSRRDLRLLQSFAAHAAAAIEKGHLYYDVIRSEEQLKETQNQLIEAERLAVIGQMTVSIRHEINNPLCNISLIAQTVCRDLENTRPELVEMLDDVMKNVRRIQEVTTKLSELKSVPLTEYLPDQLMVDLQ